MEPIEPVRVAEGEDEPSYHDDLLCLPGCDKEQEHQREEVIQDTEGEDQFRNRDFFLK